MASSMESLFLLNTFSDIAEAYDNGDEVFHDVSIKVPVPVTSVSTPMTSN